MTAQQYVFVSYQLLLDQGKKLDEIDKDMERKLDEEWERKLAMARSRQVNKDEMIKDIQENLINKIDKEKQNGR